MLKLYPNTLTIIFALISLVSAECRAAAVACDIAYYSETNEIADRFPLILEFDNLNIGQTRSEEIAGTRRTVTLRQSGHYTMELSYVDQQLRTVIPPAPVTLRWKTEFLHTSFDGEGGIIQFNAVCEVFSRPPYQPRPPSAPVHSNSTSERSSVVIGGVRS